MCRQLISFLVLLLSFVLVIFVNYFIAKHIKRKTKKKKLCNHSYATINCYIIKGAKHEQIGPGLAWLESSCERLSSSTNYNPR